jgi:general secretion pathway protein E
MNADVQQHLPTAQGGWDFDFRAWPLAQAQRWRVVLYQSADAHWAAMADQAVNPMLLERLEAQVLCAVQWLEVDSTVLDLALQSGSESFRAMDALLGADNAAAPVATLQELSALQLSEQQSPLVRLLDSVLHDALQDGASDVHMECKAMGMAIRYRIDGVMVDVRSLNDPVAAEQLVSRLKVMAELDIGERRLPQDGRFALRTKGRDIDFRLSIVPSVFGEDAVIRILDRAQISQAQGALTLEALGLDATSRAAIRKLALLPNGMLLVTGPTGSGKTTTLYAAISEVNTGRDKIITIEDPVEYHLAGVVQVPVNDKKGLTFARGLRSILRHDPDRVMVGEIRDSETAQIAVQAALTGHLVFSTVHANSAIDVIGRFMHMGLDLYDVVSALNGVVAQRLLRLNCRHCTQPVVVSPEQLQAYGLTSVATQAHRFCAGAGCSQCRGTGYQGRNAVAELLLMDDVLRDLIASRAPIGKIKAAARERGMQTLRQGALELVCQGQTTFEEVDRVTLAI